MKKVYQKSPKLPSCPRCGGRLYLDDDPLWDGTRITCHACGRDWRVRQPQEHTHKTVEDEAAPKAKYWGRQLAFGDMTCPDVVEEQGTARSQQDEHGTSTA